MGARDPFQGLDLNTDAEVIARMLSPFVPLGLDVYVLGIQEGVSDAIFEAVASYTGMYRLPLHTRLYSARDAIEDLGVASKIRSRRIGKAVSAATLMREQEAGELPERVLNTADMLDRVWGRGDGAIMTPKFTGIAVFVSPVVASYVRLLGVYKHSFGASEGSKGGVGVALGLYDVTIAFVNCHLASKRADMRRSQYCELVDRLGGKLGGRGFGLNESFHHIIWMGDLNVHCKGISSAEAASLIRSGKHMQLLMRHDELLVEKEAETIFYEYEEPLMGPRFFPTYKKIPNRGPVDTRMQDWVSKVYVTAFKEPFYKGGRICERVPSWTDRIQYHSIPDKWGELLPDSLDPSAPDTSPHNYQAVNDQLLTSDHSAIYCTWNLQISADIDNAERKGLREFVQAQQAAIGYRQGKIPDLQGSKHDAETAAIFNNHRFAGNSDFDTSILPPLLRPIIVSFRINAVLVNVGGVLQVPRAISVLFPLPFEDSDLIPERQKSHRISPAFTLASKSSADLSSLSTAIRSVVSKASKLETLHMLVKVSLDDGTKAQALISLRDGGFVSVGRHVNNFRQPLTANGVPFKVGGNHVHVQFTMEMTAVEKGGNPDAPQNPSHVSIPMQQPQQPQQPQQGYGNMPHDASFRSQVAPGGEYHLPAIQDQSHYGADATEPLDMSNTYGYNTHGYENRPGQPLAIANTPWKDPQDRTTMPNAYNELAQSQRNASFRGMPEDDAAAYSRSQMDHLGGASSSSDAHYPMGQQGGPYSVNANYNAPVAGNQSVYAAPPSVHVRNASFYAPTSGNSGQENNSNVYHPPQYEAARQGMARPQPPGYPASTSGSAMAMQMIQAAKSRSMYSTNSSASLTHGNPNHGLGTPRQ